MKKELKKRKVAIEVIPEKAVTTIGVLRGFFPSIMAQVNENELMRSNNIHFSDTDIASMKEILDEIYEKCIAQTTIREGATGLWGLFSPLSDDAAN
jgi:hypothetical protein